MDKVTKEMRSRHYVQFGYMVKDSEILAWYKGKDTEKQKKKITHPRDIFNKEK